MGGSVVVGSASDAPRQRVVASGKERTNALHGGMAGGRRRGIRLGVLAAPSCPALSRRPFETRALQADGITMPFPSSERQIHAGLLEPVPTPFRAHHSVARDQ